MRIVHIPLLLTTCASLVLPAAAEIQYKAGEGWTVVDPNGEVSVEATAGAQLDKAQNYEKNGDYHRAMIAYYQLTRQFPRSGAAPDAQLKAGDNALLAGEYDRAYTLYNEYITKYPKGEDFDKAIEGNYKVGQKFLEGARRRMFGVKTFPSMNRAQNIFESIVKTAPFSKWAPLAQYYAGQAMEKQGQPENAIAAYEEVISRYPTDPAAADAQYQIGYVYLVQSRTAYDQAAAVKAHDAFQDFLARYPNSEKAAQAQDNLKTLENKANSGSLEIARFYDKKKNYKAAVIYYNQVIKQQPGSADARVAEARIAELKTKVGDAAIEPGPEKTENGSRARESRRLQAQIDTASRADFVGPPVSQPAPPIQVAGPKRPALRNSNDQLTPVPAVEPPLPAQ